MALASRAGASLRLLWTQVAPCTCFSRRKVTVGRDYWLLGAFCLAALVSQTHSEQTTCEDWRSWCRRRQKRARGAQEERADAALRLGGAVPSPNGCACQGSAIDSGAAGALGRD